MYSKKWAESNLVLHGERFHCNTLQNLILGRESDKLVISAYRSSGKSIALAALAIQKAVCNENYTVLIYADEFIKKEVYSLVKESQISCSSLHSPNLRGDHIISFPNGSKIIIADVPSKLLGIHCDFLIIASSIKLSCKEWDILLSFIHKSRKVYVVAEDQNKLFFYLDTTDWDKITLPITADPNISYEEIRRRRNYIGNYLFHKEQINLM